MSAVPRPVPYTVGRRGEPRIPVETVRRAISDAGVTFADVCYRIGWLNPDDTADVTRLRRRLGLVASQTGPALGRRRHINTTIEEAQALMILRAIHAYPRDYGL